MSEFEYEIGQKVRIKQGAPFLVGVTGQVIEVSEPDMYEVRFDVHTPDMDHYEDTRRGHAAFYSHQLALIEES